jgi:aminoglycoside phosphotransferase (APT) family kinase protein
MSFGARSEMIEKLRDWLTDRLTSAQGLSIANVRSPKAGTSAETLLFDVIHTQNGRVLTEALVLRRQLEGADLFLDSDLRWQWQVMEAMSRQSAPPVPLLIGLEMDRSILGSPFFVMRKVEGRIVQQSPNYHREGWLAELPRERRADVWKNAAVAMAQIHRTPLNESFAFMQRSGDEGLLDNYLQYVERWYAWAAAGREQPVADKALDYLRKNKPSNLGGGLLWGDSIPANMLFKPNGEVAAVLDWEMAALGPGEVDLAWWLFFDDFFSLGQGGVRLAGLPDRNEMVAMYEDAADRQVRDLEYFEVLAMVRLGIIVVRQFDRRMTAGALSPGSKAYLNNPVTAMTARRLGLPVPEVGDDYAEMRTAH